MIPVTKPFLPPIEEYQNYISGIWSRNYLTNNGPLVNDLELKLKDYLEIPHILFVTNGTIALQIAIKALELKGEIITTPFSYVATTSSILWEGCKPVFVDIDEKTLNIDPTKIEASITSNTSAILATHVYGNPCDIDAIDVIAKKFNLKVIYDAAHCFGTKYKEKSVFAYGDISITSFHATKLFHTVEGGALFSNNPELIKKMSSLRNFGHKGYDDFDEIGINGKNSEFHAAMGLANLKYINLILTSRREQSLQYDKWLKRPNIQLLKLNKEAKFNYAYYPVLFDSEEINLKVIEALEEYNIHARRYFNPSLNTIEIFNPSKLDISESVSKRVLCLPLYHGLFVEEIDFICRIILRTLNN